MTDFDSAVQRIAREKNGDPIDVELFWDIVVALDADGTRRHEETIALVERHCEETEAWRQDHLRQFHPRRKDDPPGEDHISDRQTWVMWNVSKKVGAILLAIAVAAIVTAVNLGLNYLWFGHP